MDSPPVLGGLHFKSAAHEALLHQGFMMNASTSPLSRPSNPACSSRLLVVIAAILDELVNELAALSLDDRDNESTDPRNSDRQHPKLDDASVVFDGIRQKTVDRKVKRLDASLNNGWVSMPLPMHRRMGACILPEQGHPDKTGRNISGGFYTSTKGKWVNYSGEPPYSQLLSTMVPFTILVQTMMNVDFIPGYLQPETQLALQREMIKPVSESDESGYVYAYLIEDNSAPPDNDMHFIMRPKIGHAVNVQARLSSWERECAKQKLKLIGWYPGNIEDERLDANLSRDCFDPGTKGKYCHKLERLVHLELGDLAIHTPYLDTYLFCGVATPAIARAQASKSPSSLALNVLQKASEICETCKRVHKEIFPFVKPVEGPFKDHEWEMIIEPVIKKWGRLIKEYL